MDEITREAVHTTDGRKGDKVVTASLTDAGEKKTVTEFWVEPKVEKRLSQRVVEFERPVVHRREIETVDEATGTVVEKKVESIDPDVKMQLREHIAVQHSVKAQSVDEDCDCHVTKEELQQGLVTLAKTFADALNGRNSNVDAALAIINEPDDYQPVVPLAPKTVAKMRKARVSTAQINLGEKLQNIKSNGSWLWYGVIGLEVAALVFLFVWM